MWLRGWECGPLALLSAALSASVINYLTHPSRKAQDAGHRHQKGTVMAKNERTGKSAGKAASKGLKTGKLTPKETRKVSGSALTQRPDKPKKK